MLALILRRIVSAHLNKHLQALRRHNDNKYSVLEKAFRRIDRNTEFCKLMAMRRIIENARIRKREDRIIKYVGVLSDKARKMAVIDAFRSIVNYGNRKVNVSGKNISNSKASIMKSILVRLYKKNLTHSIHRLRYFAKTPQANQYAIINLL